MVQDSGSGWVVSAGTHKEMLLALYFRDLAAIEPVGQAGLSALSPKVKPAAAQELGQASAGELRQEWQSWWERIISNTHPSIDIQAEPDFAEFSDSPSLQHLMLAHYGNAYTWTQRRLGEYQEFSRNTTTVRLELVQQLFDERELEGEEVGALHLKLVELPLAEQRAWFIEPDTVIVSQDLMRDVALFRSYLEPIIAMLT